MDGETQRAKCLKADLFDTHFDVDEVAFILDVDRSSVLRYLRTGLMGGYQAGRLWRIREEHIRAYVAALEAPETREKRRTRRRKQAQEGEAS